MDNKSLKAKWNSSVEVVESSFKKNKLCLEGYGFTNIQDNGWMTLLLEISAIKDLNEDAVIEVKINFYNENGSIIYSNYEEIDGDDFEGYDTLELSLPEDNLAFDAVKCRIYAKKEW